MKAIVNPGSSAGHLDARAGEGEVAEIIGANLKGRESLAGSG
jgi:hypothetical protein